MPNKQAKLEKLLTLMDADAMTQEDFMKHFEQVLEIVMAIKEGNDKEIADLRETFKEAKDGLTKSYTDEKGSAVSFLKKEISKLQKEQKKTIADIKLRMDLVKDGDHGLDGKDADEEVIVDKVLKKIKLPENEVLTPEEIRNSLQELEGDARLDKTSIKGLENYINGVLGSIQIPKGGGGSGGIETFLGGNKVGSGAALELIAGTGVTITASSNDHKSNYTIAATPGALTWNSETPTGDVNGSNTDFELSDTPTTDSLFVFLNGAFQADGGDDYTLSGTTVTFVTAPPTGSTLRVKFTT